MPKLDLSCLPDGCESFMTGSRVYGTPRPDSDYDLVVLVSPATLRALHKAATTCISCSGSGRNSKGTGKCVPCNGTGQTEDKVEGRRATSDGGPTSGSFRFGPINVIAVTDRTAFMVWRKGTQALYKKRKAHGPVGRDEAKAYFQGKRKEFLGG